MERAFPTGGIASGFVKLELQNACEEIAGVGRIARNVVFCARIKGISGGDLPAA